MIYVDGNIWSIHPMAIATAREAAQKFRTDQTEQSKPRRASESLTLQRTFSADELPLEIRNGVAIVTISDVIVSWCSYCYTSHPALQQTFRMLAEQQPKNGVLILIDSPGGTAKGSAETIDALNAMQDAGVIATAQVKGGCFSAAYKIASQCRGGIYTHRMDEVGSIGTKMVLEDYSKYFADKGIEVVPITNDGATFKTLGEFGLPITDEQRQFLADYVEQVFGEFRRCVQDGRKLSDEQFSAISDGRWWLPEEAQRLGLIDGVRTFDETLAAMTPAIKSPFLREEKMATETKPADPTPAAEQKPAPVAESKPVETAPDPSPVTEQKPAETEPRTRDLNELQKFVSTFGAENGTAWFLDESCTYTDACERHIAAQQKALEAAQQKSEADATLLKQIGEKLGQLDPLQLEKKEAKEEAGSNDPKTGSTLAEIIAARNAKK